MTTSPPPEIEVLSNPARPCHLRLFSSHASRTRGKMSRSRLPALLAVGALAGAATAAARLLFSGPDKVPFILAGAAAGIVLASVIVYVSAFRPRAPRELWIEGDRFFWRHRRSGSLPLAEIERFECKTVWEEPRRADLMVRLAAGEERRIIGIDDLSRPSAAWLEDRLNDALEQARR
jgi:hypothetical protein